MWMNLLVLPFVVKMSMDSETEVEVSLYVIECYDSYPCGASLSTPLQLYQNGVFGV
jgi:hypothetical protein